MKGHTYGICRNCGKFHGNHPKGMLGKKAWNKGIPLTDEHKENIRRKNIGRKMTEESKRKNSLSHLGKKRPNTSETLKILWQKPEFREKMKKFTNKGKHHSKETIEKIRIGNIGWKHTSESRKKMSESKIGKNLGHIPWNKGLKGIYHHSPEIKEIIRKKAIGRKHSIQTKKKISEKQKGIKRSAEFCKINSIAHKKFHQTKEGRILIQKILKIRWSNPMEHEKLSEQTKKRWLDPIFRKNQKEKHKLYWGKPENKIKKSIIMKKRYEDPLERIKQSERMKKALSNPEIKPKWSNSMKKKWCDEKYRNKVVKSMIKKPNKMEIFVLSILNKNFPNEWKFVGDFSLWIEGKNPDFINCNGQKKIIEVFGNRWHDKNYVSFARTEEGTKNHYKEYGFETLVLWGNDLRCESGRKKAEMEIIDFHNK